MSAARSRSSAGTGSDAPAPGPRHTLHIVSGKGGTGKTTVASAMACALATSGRRVLVCEVEGRQGIAELFETSPLTESPERRILRMFGVSESAVAKALADAGGDGDGVEVTICARDFEIHVDLVVEPDAESRASAFADAFLEPLRSYLFTEDERTVADIVLDACRVRGLRLGTAESCTGGLVAARLTDVPGSSDVFAGSVIAYADEVKIGQLGVPEELLAEHGAVSAEVAAAMAEGIRSRLGVDVGIAVTGVAGPGGGTDDKPVGLVHFHVATPGGSDAGEFSLPADRDTIRSRATVAALHLARRVLTRNRHEEV